MTTSADITKALNYDAKSGKCLVPFSKNAPAWACFIAIDSKRNGDSFTWSWKSVNFKDSSSDFHAFEVEDEKVFAPCDSLDSLRNSLEHCTSEVADYHLIEGGPIFKIEDSLHELFTATAGMMKSFKDTTVNDIDGSGNGYVEFSMYDPSGTTTDGDVLSILKVRGCVIEGTRCHHEYDCGGTYFRPLAADSIQRFEVDCGVMITVKQSFYTNM